MPEHSDALLDWEFVSGHMSAGVHYWIATASADGKPHAAPVWGLWLDDRFHFDGSTATRWARNLAANPRVAVHLPAGDQVVIIEGEARMIDDDELTDEEWAEVDTLYRLKYRVDEGSPFRYVQPTKVLAWDGDDLHTMTRWLFEPTD